MQSTKAAAIADWCTAEHIPFTRFDYSGHGKSDGRPEDGTISAWLNEAQTVLSDIAAGPQILIGSSMGSWIALLLLRQHVRRNLQGSANIKGMVLIAPAWDMTEKLIWQKLPQDAKDQIEDQGIFYTPSDYGDGPYPITQALIMDGRQHLLAGTTLQSEVPIRILHGKQDEDVPWENSVELLEVLKSGDVTVEFIEDGGHRLSRDSDIVTLKRVIADLLVVAKQT